MKKLFMIAALMVVTLSANAQGMFIKPMVGATLSSFVGDFTEDEKYKVGLVAGAEFGYFFNENMGVTAGLLYTMQGSKDKNAEYNENLDYLNIPILFNYYIFPGFAVKAGIQPGFLVRAKYDDESLKDFYKSTDFAIPMGVSYEFSDFVIDARYNLGVANILEHSGDYKQRNSVFQLTLGYKIPF